MFSGPVFEDVLERGGTLGRLSVSYLYNLRKKLIYALLWKSEVRYASIEPIVWNAWPVRQLHSDFPAISFPAA
jgi:hypothetical protein